MNDIENKLIIIMGVSGCGKSTIASLLSQMQNWPTLEGDDLHPEENIQKMADGRPLSNDDRMPWLEAIANAVNNLPSGPILLACSALNDIVRMRLKNTVNRPCRWILLDVPESILTQRLTQRKGHFMKPSMLNSQLKALEVPMDAIRIDATLSPDTICDEIIRSLINTS